MASIKNLKKDINNTLGDIIEAVYVWESTSGNKDSKKGDAIIDSAIETFDDLIAKLNNKNVENRKAHLAKVNKELEDKAISLIEKVNKLA